MARPDDKRQRSTQSAPRRRHRHARDAHAIGRVGAVEAGGAGVLSARLHIIRFFCVGAAQNGEGYDLNFENAPVATLARVILGDLLGVGYTIDPRVQGSVTLASGRPVRKSDMLFLLENALRLSNVALLRDVSGYRLMPVSEAIGTGQLDVRR